MLVVLFGAFVCWITYSAVQEYRTDRIPALLYHHFAPGKSADRETSNDYHPVYFCYEEAFDQQMSYLQHEGYTTIVLDDFIAFQKNQKPLPPKPIILTFDDGFMSNYLYALPILTKYEMTATLFMTVDRAASNFIKYAAVDSPLTDLQLKEMNAQGVAVESHSMTHPYLSDLTPDLIWWELFESRKSLETLLQKPIKFIAIPSGAYNQTVKRLVRQAGYEAAFCMLKGTNNRGSDPYALRRLVIGRDFTLEDFRRILEPRSALFLRLTSSIQNALLFLLGPEGLDALRDFIYRVPLGTSLIRGQLRYVVPGIAAVVVLSLIGMLVIFRSSF